MLNIVILSGFFFLVCLNMLLQAQNSKRVFGGFGWPLKWRKQISQELPVFHNITSLYWIQIKLQLLFKFSNWYWHQIHFLSHRKGNFDTNCSYPKSGISTKCCASITSSKFSSSIFLNMQKVKVILTMEEDYGEINPSMKSKETKDRNMCYIGHFLDSVTKVLGIRDP